MYGGELLYLRVILVWASQLTHPNSSWPATWVSYFSVSLRLLQVRVPLRVLWGYSAATAWAVACSLHSSSGRYTFLIWWSAWWRLVVLVTILCVFSSIKLSYFLTYNYWMTENINQHISQKPYLWYLSELLGGSTPLMYAFNNWNVHTLSAKNT